MSKLDKLAVAVLSLPFIIGAGALFLMCLETPMLFLLLAVIILVLILQNWAEHRLAISNKARHK